MCELHDILNKVFKKIHNIWNHSCDGIILLKYCEIE